MNYQDLKVLSPQQLIEHLEKQLSSFNGFINDAQQQKEISADELKNPVLFLIGDFEIRARFQN